MAGAVLTVVFAIAYFSGGIESDVDNLGKAVNEVKVNLGSVQDKVQNLSEDVSYIRGRLDEREAIERPAPTKLSDSSNLSMKEK